jgi:zinc protease
MSLARRRRSREAVLVLALLALLAAPGGAQTPPAASPTDLVGPLLGSRFTLPNGIVVLVAERPALPIVSMRVALGAGAVLDPPDKPGLANLTALLLDRGTQRRTALEIDRAIEFVGGSLDTEGGRDASTAALAVLRRDLDLGLDLLADVLLRPVFPEAEVERKRDEVRASIRESEQDPETVAGRLLRRLAFPRHPYGAPVAGTEESLGRITRDDVVGFYRASYRPETTIIALAGAVTLVDARAAIRARFGAWTAAGPGVTPPGPAPIGTPARTETVQREITQASVYLGQATVGRSHPDYYPLLIASHILGGGSASRLYTRVREERGLAYSVFADYITGRLGGLLLAGFQSENARVREVLTLVREDLEQLGRQKLADDELSKAKAHLVGSFPLRTITNPEVALLLLAIEQYGLGLDYPTRHRRAIERVTADDILRAVRTHWDPSLMSLAVVGNLREAGLATP